MAGSGGTSRAEIPNHVRLRTHSLAESHELVAAEAVALDIPTPVLVDRPAPLLLRPDTIPPVVAIRKAAARPAQVGHAKLGERGHHLFAQAAIRVGDTVVYAPAKVLKEESKDVAADLRPGAKVGTHHERIVGVRAGRGLVGVDDRERERERVHIQCGRLEHTDWASGTR